MRTLSFKRSPLEDRQKIQIAGLEGAIKASKDEVSTEKRNRASHVKSERVTDANWRKYLDSLFRGLRKDCAALQRIVEDKEANYRATTGFPRYDEPGSRTSKGKWTSHKDTGTSPRCNELGVQTSGGNRNGNENGYNDQGYQEGSKEMRKSGTLRRRTRETGKVKGIR